MTDIAIQVTAVGKKYQIGTGGGYRSFRQVFGQRVKNLPRRLASWLQRTKRSSAKAQATDLIDPSEFWALQQISFEIGQGDRVGLIGRNGAGKSTLLKILSRITEPTTGRIRIRGRVASLLEVGTGFHQELTGRENIYLNGAILGMTRHEIRRKFDEIVAFAEVEKFINTPVKYYSSGMYVRLAFAVAAHLEPEILIIDEVLAVGDAAFQRKCLGKMEDVSRAGRTVIFVSHNMATIERLCNHGILLVQGRLEFVGNPAEAIERYLGEGIDHRALTERHDRKGSGELRITRIDLCNQKQEPIYAATSGEGLEIRLHFECRHPCRVYVGIIFKTGSDITVFSHGNFVSQKPFSDLPTTGVFTCQIPRLPLPVATYYLSYNIVDHEDGHCIDQLSDVLELPVTLGDFFGSGYNMPSSLGVCLVDADWQVSATKI